MSNQIFHFSNSGIASGQRFYLKDDVSGIFVRNLNIDSNFPILASNLVYNTGNQNISGIKNFTSRPTVNGTGVLLSGEASNVTLPATVVYTTGNQTISGNKTFAQDTVFGDSTEDNIFVVSGNQISFGVRPTVNGTGVLLSGEAAALGQNVVYTTGNQTISGEKQFQSHETIFGEGSIGWVRITDDSYGGEFGMITNGDEVIAVKMNDGSFQYGGGSPGNAPIIVNSSGNVGIGTNNPSEKLQVDGNIKAASGVYATNLVYNTGNQNISGIKNFYSRPTVNGTGVLLSGEAPNPTTIVYITGDQVISGVKSFTNNLVLQDNILFSSQASGYLTGVGYSGNYDGGYFLGRTKLSQNTSRLVDSSFGNTWVAKDSDRNWYGISISSDGKYQSAVVNGGQVYISSDYGNSWAAKDSRSWFGISISSDGKYQSATVIGGQIYVSSNYGNSWVAKDIARNWYGISISSDGKYQSAVVLNGQIYISSDYGNSWAAKDSSRSWRFISISSDGKYQSATAFNEQIYVSSDYGNSWVAKDIARNWYGISISSDGKYQTAVAGGPGRIYVSSDYGNSWVAKDSSRNWYIVSISSDGKYQSAVVLNGQIYISSDYGNSWAAKESNRGWYGISISSNGKYISAVVGLGKIYTSKTDELVDGNFYADNLVYNTGNQNISGIKNFYSRPTVNGTGVLLSGEASNVTLPATVVYTTGNQTISGNKTFAQDTVFGDSTEDNIFVVSGNKVSFGVRPTVNGTGVLLSGEAAALGQNVVYTTGDQTINGTKTFNVAPMLSGNPFITGVNLSSYVTTGQTGVFYPRNNPSGFITGVNLSSYVTTGQTGVFYPRNNPSGFISSADFSRVVYTTGDQNISGVKNFYSRPTVNGIGVLLSGEVTPGGLPNTIVYTTGNQTIFGVKTFENISGDSASFNNVELNSIDLNSIDVLSLSGVDVSIISGNVILTNRPTVNGIGVLLSGEAAGLGANIVYTTGNQNISGTKNFYSRPTVNGSGVLLSGEAVALVGQNVVYTTGNQSINGLKDFTTLPRVNGNNLVDTYQNQTIYGDKFFLNNIGVSGLSDFRNVKVKNIDKLFLSGLDMNVSSIDKLFISGIDMQVSSIDQLYFSGVDILLTGNSSVNLFNNIYISGNPVSTGGAVIPENIVYTFGDQTISGVKTFAEGFSSNGYIHFDNNLIIGTTGTLNNISIDLYDAGVDEFYQQLNWMHRLFRIQTAGGGLSGFAFDISGGEILHYNNYAGNKLSNIYFKSGAIDLANNKLINAPNVVYHTGNQIISGNKTFHSSGVFSLSGEIPLTLPNNPLSVVGSGNNYLQLNIQNRATGAFASADLVITANNGTDSSNYINLGINNSGYSDPAFTNGTGFDGYLFIDGGNLDIGTRTSGKAIEFHAGGTTSGSTIARISSSGLNIVSGNLTVKNTGVLLAGQNSFIMSLFNTADSPVSGHNYFGNLAAIFNNVQNNRRFPVLESCIVKRASWSQYVTTVGVPSQASTGYFINTSSVPPQTGIISTSISTLSTSTPTHYIKEFSPPITISSGDYIVCSWFTPTGTTVPGFVRNSVNLYCYN